MDGHVHVYMCRSFFFFFFWGAPLYISAPPAAGVPQRHWTGSIIADRAASLSSGNKKKYTLRMRSVYFASYVPTNINVPEGCHCAELGGGHFGRDKTLSKIAEGVRNGR